MRPRPLLGKPLDQIDQRLDEVQDCGDKDDGLQGFVLIAVFLFPGHFVHLPCFSVTIISRIITNVKCFCYYVTFFLDILYYG